MSYGPRMLWFHRYSLIAAVAGWASGLHGAAPAQLATNAIPSPAPSAAAASSDRKEPAAMEGEKPAAQNASTEVEPEAEVAPAEAPKPESPYQAIVARNAFGLKTPPPAPPPPEAPVPQVSPSALKLTGVFTMLGNRSAMFVLQEPGKPQLNSELVREGEKDSVITNLEVLTIDERAAAVRVVYGGKELTLDFVSNGLKPPAAPATPPGGPGTPGAPGVPVRPGSVPGGTTPGIHPAGGVAGIGGNTPGVYQPGTFQPGVYQPAAANFNANPAVSAISSGGNPSGLQSIPTRPTRMPFGTTTTTTGTGFGGTAAQNQQMAIPPEQQALLMRAQEEISRRQGVPFPPSPPIPGLDGSGQTGPPQPPE